MTSMEVTLQKVLMQPHGLILVIGFNGVQLRQAL